MAVLGRGLSLIHRPLISSGIAPGLLGLARTAFPPAALGCDTPHSIRWAAVVPAKRGTPTKPPPYVEVKINLDVPKPVPPHPVSSLAEERRRRERIATQYFDFPLTSLKGESKGTIPLATAVFQEPARVDLLQRVVLWQQARKRPDAKEVKTRDMVRGGGRKPYKQKGMGRARAGSIRSPLWRGGGKAHGPSKKSWAFDLPKKVRRLALRVAISARLREGKLIVVDDLDIEEHKTSLLQSVLDERGVDNALIISNDFNDNFKRAAANIPNVDTLEALGSNVYSILKRRHLVLSKSGVDYLHTFLLRL